MYPYQRGPADATVLSAPAAISLGEPQPELTAD